jgi:hypothetical protein
MSTQITLNNGYKVMCVNWASSDIVNAAMKQKGEEESGESEHEEERREYVSQSMALQCVDTLLDYMGQRRLEGSNTMALQPPGKLVLP